MKQFNPVPLFAVVGVCLVVVIAVVAAGYDARASFATGLRPYLPLLILPVLCVLLFVLYCATVKKRQDH